MLKNTIAKKAYKLSNEKKVSEERYEFVGRIASPRIRNKYKSKSLRGLYPPQTWQKSFKYINIPE